MKKVEISIACDECGKELRVDSAYPARYALVLSAANVGVNTGNIVYAVAVLPPLEQDHYFCDFVCLSGWVQKTAQVKRALPSK